MDVGIDVGVSVTGDAGVNGGHSLTKNEGHPRNREAQIGPKSVACVGAGHCRISTEGGRWPLVIVPVACGAAAAAPDANEPVSVAVCVSVGVTIDGGNVCGVHRIDGVTWIDPAIV